MDKLHRDINHHLMNESKNRSIDFVMNEISKPKTTLLSFKILKPALMSTLVLVIALVIVFTSPNTITDTPPFTISAFESQKLAEISYITGNFIGSSITVENNQYTKLSTLDGTEFENNDEQINLYFDTLRVFLEDDAFNDNITVTELTDSEFDHLIEFELNGNIYQFFITITEDGVIIGQLTIGIKVFVVTGTFEETSDELKIVLEASNGNDYVHIEYKTESEDEIESKYSISQRINNIESSKEVKISVEDNESKIEITEGNDEYTLKKEIEDGNVQYKLEYQINGVSGTARITEELDINGNTSYNYNVEESGEQKNIQHNKPNYDYEDESEEDDQTDDEDNNGNGNDNGKKKGEDDSLEEESNKLPSVFKKESL